MKYSKEQIEKEIIYLKIKKEQEEYERLKEQEYQYIHQMVEKYGDEWYYFVLNTSEDCYIAERYRDLDYENMKLLYPDEYAAQFIEEDETKEGEEDVHDLYL